VVKTGFSIRISFFLDFSSRRRSSKAPCPEHPKRGIFRLSFLQFNSALPSFDRNRERLPSFDSFPSFHGILLFLVSLEFVALMVGVSVWQFHSYFRVTLIHVFTMENNQPDDEKTPPATIKCPVCSKSFDLRTTRKDNFKLHVARHSPSSKRYPCERCRTAFKTKQHLNNHFKATHDV
jgi:hypothetical protein